MSYKTWEEAGRRTNWVRNYDCVQNVTAGRRMWCYSSQRERKNNTDGNTDSGNTHTRFINAYLPALTTAFQHPRDVTSERIRDSSIAKKCYCGGTLPTYKT